MRSEPDVDLLVEGGVATFPARTGLDTAVYDHGGSILRHEPRPEEPTTPPSVAEGG